MRRLWLLFAQVVTVALALYFVVAALRPDWLGWRRGPVEPAKVASNVSVLQAPGTTPAAGSYREAAGRAMPAVVNILTSKTGGASIRSCATRSSGAFSATACRPRSSSPASAPV